MTKEQKIFYKNKLKQTGYSIIEQRIADAKAAIEEAQLSANQEEKSSAGDKYETSRAMSHLEKDLHSRQLAAQLKELENLHSVNTSHIYTTPAAGAVIQCTHVSFFIAAGLGRQFHDGELVVFLSPHAPLAKSLYGKKKGDSIIFDGVGNFVVDIF